MSKSSLDILSFPDLLCNSSVQVESLELYGRRIGEDASLIDVSLICNTSSRIRPDPSTVWPDEYRNSPEVFAGITSSNYDKRHYWIPDERKSRGLAKTKYEWPLEYRIRHVIEHGNNLSTAEGHSYIIKDRRIIGFNLNPQAISYFRSLTKRDLIHLFGLPDFIRERSGDDPELFSTELYYQHGILLLYIDYSKRLEGILIRSNIHELVLVQGIEAYTGQPTELFD